MVTRHGFSQIEAVAVVVIAVILFGILLPMASKARLADGLAISENNVRQILIAQQMYYQDHAGQIPMRGHGYSNGQITGGWDTWEFGGKNCSAFYQTYQGGVFDESAYSRPLNHYLAENRIPRPFNYTSTGAGPTWNFNPGTPSAAERQNLKIEVFHSPRDFTSIERNWPNPTPGISAYDDIGTSYVLNMKWWDQPDLASFSFTNRLNEGVRRISLAAQTRPSTFVWIHDEVGEIVPYSSSMFKGQYGGANMSVVGFLDGRVDYLNLVSNATSGPGYTLEVH